MPRLSSATRTALAMLCLSLLPAVTANAQTVIATIPVSGFPGFGSIDETTNLAYIPTDANVSIINQKTHTLVGAITVDASYPVLTAALNPLTGLLYVGTENGGLYIVNAKTRATVGYVNVNAASVAVNPLTNKVYVSDFESYLYVIDGASNNIETSVPVDGIQNIVLNPFNNRIYAAYEGGFGGVVVIDGNTNKVIAQPNGGSGPSFDVAVDPFRDVFYSSEFGFTGTGSATVYSGRTNTQTAVVSLPNQPAGIVQDPVTNLVYVANDETNVVYVIDGNTNKLLTSVPVGTQPEYLTDDPIHKLLYVGCANSDPNTPGALLYVIKTK